MSSALDWEREGRIWPHREASSFVDAGGLHWHIQRMGGGPKVLLLHGTGASVHSWHRLMPRLAEHFDVMAPDLPGHAFTRGRIPGGQTLNGMAKALAALLERVSFTPDLVVGHSAGAALAIGWVSARSPGTPIVGLNPAIMPFRGPAAQVFPAMAKLLLVNPFAPRIFARLARVPGEAGRFLKRSTGSSTDAVSEACYAALFGNHRHARGALEMMANWDLGAFQRLLPTLQSSTLLLHGKGDLAIPLASVRKAAALIPDSASQLVPSAGHLLHEELPEKVGEAILAFAREAGLIREEQPQEAP